MGQYRKMAVFDIASVVDRHCIDADPDPTYYFDVDPDPTVLHMLGNHKFVVTFIHSSTGIHCFIFLGSVTGVIIFNILDTILKCSRKSIIKLDMWLNWLRITIRIGRPWMPIWIRIRQKDTAPTGSGSTTLVIATAVSANVPKFRHTH